jgi:hypothetical protein
MEASDASVTSWHNFLLQVFITCLTPMGRGSACRASDAIRSGIRYAKWAGGSRSQTHRRAAMGGFTQDDGYVRGLAPTHDPPSLDPCLHELDHQGKTCEKFIPYGETWQLWYEASMKVKTVCNHTRVWNNNNMVWNEYQRVWNDHCGMKRDA